MVFQIDSQLSWTIIKLVWKSPNLDPNNNFLPNTLDVAKYC